MKKKIFAAVVAGALACVGAFGLFGCGSDDGADAAANGAAATGTLVVGFDAEFPPYGYLADAGEEGYVAEDGNTYTGFDLDLAAAVCEANGWELVVTPIDWDAKDALLGAGTINCIWNGFTMEGREDGYTFSEPYMNNTQIIVVRADSDIISSADLAGKNVMTQIDSAALELFEGEEAEYAELAATFAGGAIQTISSFDNAFMQLESGAVDAVACDLSQYMVQQAAKPGVFQQLGDDLSSEHYAVGLAIGDEETAGIITETLKTLFADGKVAQIAAKYGDGIDMNLWCLQ